MKTLMRSFCFLILLSVAFVSCKDEDKEDLLPTPIVQNSGPSLSSLYLNKQSLIVFDEEITVIATASDVDKDLLKYTWTCTGGEFIGSGSNVKWKAPKAVGKYTISVSITDGTDSISEQKELDVVGSYCFQFSKSSSDWGKTSKASISLSDGVAIISDTSVTEIAALSYAMSSPVSVPYSIKTKVAVRHADFNSSSTRRNSYYFWFENPNNGSNYLSSVALLVSPVVKSWEIRAGIYNVSSGMTEYQILEAGSVGSNKVIFSQNDEYHTIGMSITAEKTLIINVDGNELYRSTVLGDKLIYPGTLKLRQFSYSVDPLVKTLVDDFYITTDGTILK